MVTQLLSGSSAPMESMPVWLQHVMQTISPTPHFVAFAQACCSPGPMSRTFGDDTDDAPHRHCLFRHHQRPFQAPHLPRVTHR
jgi:hypothetical protein